MKLGWWMIWGGCKKEICSFQARSWKQSETMSETQQGNWKYNRPFLIAVHLASYCHQMLNNTSGMTLIHKLLCTWHPVLEKLLHITTRGWTLLFYLIGNTFQMRKVTDRVLKLEFITWEYHHLQQWRSCDFAADIQNWDIWSQWLCSSVVCLCVDH